MEQPTLIKLKEQTCIFFQNHWSMTSGEPPEWSHVHSNFGKIPNYDKQGLYAFVKEDIITYIGIGISRGGGLYRGNGLSNRFMKYCRWSEAGTEYIAKDPRLKDAGAVVTIGFKQDTAYLASALEVFLISRLEPIHNIIKSGT